MKPDTFDQDSGKAYPDKTMLNLKELAEQECKYYLKKSEGDLIKEIIKYLIERDKPEGEDE